MIFESFKGQSHQTFFFVKQTFFAIKLGNFIVIVLFSYVKEKESLTTKIGQYRKNMVW